LVGLAHYDLNRFVDFVVEDQFLTMRALELHKFLVLLYQVLSSLPKEFFALNAILLDLLA